MRSLILFSSSRFRTLIMDIAHKGTNQVSLEEVIKIFLGN